jgi:hypothetical protein
MANTYTLISSQVLAATATTITFSSIPSIYTDLVLRISARSDGAAQVVSTRLRYNGITTTTYSRTLLQGSGSAATSSRTSSSSQHVFIIDGATSTANTFASTEIYIPSYTASQNKAISGFSVSETNATAAEMTTDAYLWSNTAAINAIEISLSSTNFLIDSSFYLYGISNS